MSLAPQSMAVQQQSVWANAEGGIHGYDKTEI